ncbi:MAG: hypothetical protein E7352_03140 [Clostridiales bacterium]|nr:hypothetical protein [Clostridiales bacterium]
MPQESKWKKFIKQLNNPPTWVATIAFAATLILCPLALATIVTDYAHTVYAIVAYMVCALVLLYTLYVLILSIQRLRKKMGEAAGKFKITRNIYKSYESRSIFSGVCSSLFNVGYTVFLTIMAIRYHSAWYGAMALYHILLVLTLGGVLLRNATEEHKNKNDFVALKKSKIGVFRYCGYMLLIQSAALSISVLEMLMGGVGMKIPKWSLIPFALFACWRIIASMINFVRSTKYDDLAVRAVRYLKMVTALVSALTLFTALLAAFPLEPDSGVTILSGVVGGGICAVIVALGGYMIAFSETARKRMRIREEREKELAAAQGGYNRDGYREEYNNPAQTTMQNFFNTDNNNPSEK